MVVSPNSGTENIQYTAKRTKTKMLQEWRSPVEDNYWGGQVEGVVIS